MWQGRIDRLIQQVERSPDFDWATHSASPEINSYFKELASDKEKLKRIQEYFEQNNPAPLMNLALRRAFGDHLIQFNESNDNSESWWSFIENVYAPVMKGFFYVNNIAE